MALILYKCDTCKRTIGKPQNPKGLEIINRCVITLGCRGKLYQEDVLEDFVRGEIPADVVGLDNWQQRRALYNHNQLKKESTWRIVHNLGTAPTISTFVDSPTLDDADNRIEVTPQDVKVISSDIIEVVFSSPQTGIAQLVARSTDPQLFQPTSVVADEATVVQITTGGEITIATRLAASPPVRIQVQLIFTTPAGIDVPITYEFGDNPSILSPWVSVNRALIKGKIYLVRSFNPTARAVQTGIVPDNSLVRIIGFNPDVFVDSIAPIEADKIFILLADSPYAGVDRVKDKTIDAFDLSTVSATKQMVYLGGELHVTPAAIQSIHPAIRTV